MLNIVLCEDEPEVLRLVKKYIEGYCEMEGLQDVKIELATDDPLEVLDLFRENISQPDGTVKRVAKPLKHRLLYLDINLGEKAQKVGLDGVILAREIRKFDIGADIAFLTSNSTMISDVLTYKIAPIAYLKKPFIAEDKEALQSEVLNLFKHAYERMSKSTVDKKMIEFKSGHRKMYVNLADVYYICGNEQKDDPSVSEEIREAQTILCETGGKQYLRRPLNFYNKKIPELVKLGKFYLINPQKMKETIATGKSGMVKLLDGTEIRVTRKALNDFEEALKEVNG